MFDALGNLLLRLSVLAVLVVFLACLALYAMAAMGFNWFCDQVERGLMSMEGEA